MLLPPGPVELVYGSESPVDAAEVARHISSARRRRLPISHLGFFGTTFRRGASLAFRSLGRKLKNKVHVKELAVCGVPGVGNEAIESLAPFLNSNRTLRSLDLTGATFDADAIRRFQHFFKSNSSLEVVVLGENSSMGDKGVVAVTSALEAGDRGRIRVLALESCGLGHTSTSSITNFMIEGGGESLRILELSNNNIRDAGAKTLSKAIWAGHQLSRLGLNNAEIGDLGANALAKVLRHNHTLNTLTLQKNPGITNVGAFDLLKVIYDNDSVKRIIGSNHILRDLNVRGCNNISGDLLQTLTKLSARGRLLEKQHEVLRLKIVSHIEDAKCGLAALEDFNLKLMPHILNFVGRSCKSSGATCLFQSLNSMPLLYNHHDPSTVHPEPLEAGAVKKQAEEKDRTEDEKGRQYLRKARNYYAIFRSLAPKCKFILRPVSAPNDGKDTTIGIRYHEVQPTDTFQGICLRYNVTPAELRQSNKMMGSNLALAPEKLVIPTNDNGCQLGGCCRAKSKAEMVSSLISNVAFITRNRLSCTEAQAYLEIADWDLDCAIEDVREDLRWDP